MHTYRQGIASRVGHDLVLRADRWRAQVTFDRAVPLATLVEATVATASLRVLSSHGGVLPLTPLDRREIHRAMRQDVLEAERYPEARFTASGGTEHRMRGAVERLKLRGQLTLRDVAAPLTVAVVGRPDGEMMMVTGEARIRPSRWGIRQYTAFLGALKVKDDVLVRIELRLPAPP